VELSQNITSSYEVKNLKTIISETLVETTKKIHATQL